MKHTTQVHIPANTLNSQLSQYSKGQTTSLHQYKQELLLNPGLSGFNGDLCIQVCKTHNSCLCMSSREKSDGGILLWKELRSKTTHIDFILFLTPKNPNYKDRPYSINMFYIGQTLSEYQVANGNSKTVGYALADKIIAEQYGTCVNFDKNFHLFFDARVLFSSCTVERGYSVITKKQNSLILAYPHDNTQNTNPYIKLYLRNLAGEQLTEQERIRFFSLVTHLHEQLTKAAN